MEALYPKCTFRGIRGNVQTRMYKLETEGYDGTLLAAAGLKRLGMEKEIRRYFSVEEMIPAAGRAFLPFREGRRRRMIGLRAWTVLRAGRRRRRSASLSAQWTEAVLPRARHMPE